MRIFTIRRMVTLAVIGVAYVHGKRRGDLTLTSITDTLNYVWSSTADRFGISDRAQRRPVPRTGSVGSQSSHGSQGSQGSMSSSSATPANGLPGDRMRRPNDA
jgi:hypothetical protein